jgi:hypothetical protein
MFAKMHHKLLAAGMVAFLFTLAPSAYAQDCNNNGIPDECDIDCGPVGGPCDVPGCGQSLDCNDNGVPDECDVSAGTSADCNANGVPDECDVAIGQVAKLLAADGAEGDAFGRDVALSGEWVLVGAPRDGDLGPYSGSAYLFRREGDAWTQKAKLLPDDGMAQDDFGTSVALLQDMAVVGAPGAGGGGYTPSAYVFRYSAGTWTQEAMLEPDVGTLAFWFGCSVAVSGDVVVVGAYGEDSFAGSAYVFRRNGDTWTQEAKLVPTEVHYEHMFGSSVAVSDNLVVVGSVTSWLDDTPAAAYVFRHQDGTWTQEAKLLPSGSPNTTSTTVAVSGDVILVGILREAGCGSADIFRYSEGAWAHEATLVSEATVSGGCGSFGRSVDLLDNLAMVGASNEPAVVRSGAAYVFRHVEGMWTQVARLLPADGAYGDAFGVSVAISHDVAVAGASFTDDMGTDSGSVYVHRVPDCNANGVPDECDIADGTSQDCNGNGVPDECDIAGGMSADDNDNGIPDECELLPGDLNCDGLVNAFDIDPFVLALTSSGQEPPFAGYFAAYPGCNPMLADCNADGLVNAFDIDPFVQLLTAR